MTDHDPITPEQARDYAWTDTGKAPGSRYGTDPSDFIPVALRLAEIVADETGEPLTRAGVDHALSLVVNDHDDPANLIADYCELAEALDLLGDTLIERWEAEARKLGADAARAAASWTTDGNMDADERARVLAMMRDGDPAADDHLPARPTLSGQWADDPTPQSLAREIVGAGLDELDPDTRELWRIDATIAEEWEEACSETFSEAVEAELIKFCEG